MSFAKPELEYCLLWLSGTWIMTSIVFNFIFMIFHNFRLDYVKSIYSFFLRLLVLYFSQSLKLSAYPNCLMCFFDTRINERQSVGTEYGKKI